jgi:solute carrier family 6 GABA transporter-like protein 1
MAIGGILKKFEDWFAPPPKKADDGRDQWPSRAAFLLAAMGGCAGQGNLLRYPSVVYNNHGLQWFIPYLLAVFLIAIPALILEISIGKRNPHLHLRLSNVTQAKRTAVEL